MRGRQASKVPGLAHSPPGLGWSSGLTLHSPFVSCVPTCTVVVLRVTLGQVLSKRSGCSGG